MNHQTLLVILILGLWLVNGIVAICTKENDLSFAAWATILIGLGYIMIHCP